MTALVEQKLLDTLVTMRSDFIEMNVQATLLHQKAISLSREIDSGIPNQNAGYIDSFDTVFNQISTSLGEHTKGRVRPKEASIQHQTEKQIREITTKAVDGTLWKMLFNRLGLFTSMSENQIDLFKNDCNTNPQPFTLAIVQETLASMYESHDEILMDALYDVFTGLKASYVSNDARQFRKKIIIEDSFFEYGHNFKLQSHASLETLLNIVWRWVLVNKWKLDEKGVKPNSIWDELSEVMKSSDQDYDEVSSVTSYGIEFKFFKKKTVHVIFPESMIAILNDQLAKTRSLPTR